MNPIATPVTHPSYSRCVTIFPGHSCTSEAQVRLRGAGYADPENVHRHAGARVRVRACVCTYMRVLRNYVTQEEEKKEQQVKATKTGYAHGYAAVTQCVTGPALNRITLRAEVTHA